jgi:hypothetical protein
VARDSAVATCESRTSIARVEGNAAEYELRSLRRLDEHDLAAYPEALGRQTPGQPPDRILLWTGDSAAGASIADTQDVLGHESDKMSRYAGEARKFAAANLIAKYSLAG